MPAFRPVRFLLALTKRVGLIVIAVNLLIPVVVVLIPEPAPPADVRPSTPELVRTNKRATIRYQTTRDTMIDLLLPEGVGGTTVSAQVDSTHDGVTFPARAAIVIRAEAVLDSVVQTGTRRGDRVELHERAHLLDANHPELVLALLQHVPAPDPDEYAATNGGEHFAEMVANAWVILQLYTAQGFCPDPLTALHREEKAVPGTAGAVAWLIPAWERVRGIAIDSAFHRAVDSLSAPYQHEWQALGAAVERRRLANGHLAAWPELNRAMGLRRARLALLQGPGVPRRVVGMMLWPAATFARWIASAS